MIFNKHLNQVFQRIYEHTHSQLEAFHRCSLTLSSIAAKIPRFSVRGIKTESLIHCFNIRSAHCNKTGKCFQSQEILCPDVCIFHKIYRLIFVWGNLNESFTPVSSPSSPRISVINVSTQAMLSWELDNIYLTSYGILGE